MAVIPATETKVVLFCGGKGTRMWPISKIGHPKQFGPILGTKSFFRQAIERVLKGFKKQDIFISTGNDFAEVVHKQAPEIPKTNIILEPVMRDTLGAVGLAAAKINFLFPNSVMIILWGADHLIKKEEEFIKALKKAAELAQIHNVVVHLDMKPTYPSVHNGWIKIGKLIKTENGYKIYEFIKQVEKPDLTTAKAFFKSGSYLIHSGYMACQPKLLLQKYQQHNPDCYKHIEKISSSFNTPSAEQVLKSEYPLIEKNSVDFGIFEKLEQGSQWELPVEIGWVDLGTWELIYNGLPKDKNNNVVLGHVELLETSNSLVLAKDKKLVGLIGVNNLIVVDTADGLLVCAINKAPLVKQLYHNLLEKKI